MSFDPIDEMQKLTDDWAMRGLNHFFIDEHGYNNDECLTRNREFRIYVSDKLDKNIDPLSLSILKWMLVCDGWITGLGSCNCACCTAYYCGDSDKRKLPCPIYLDTGFPECRETPYQEYCETEEYSSAVAELQYLEDLQKRNLPSKRKASVKSRRNKEKSINTA